MRGLHLLADLHDCHCARTLLHELPPLRRLCLDACAAAGLTVVAETFHAFGTPGQPAGATGAVVLAESHLAVHTWPELNAVTLDLYVCNFSRDNTAAAEQCFAALCAAFAAGHLSRQTIHRGADRGSNFGVPACDFNRASAPPSLRIVDEHQSG